MSISTILVCALIGLLSYLAVSFKRSRGYWQSLGIPCEEPHLFMGSFTGLRTARSFADICMSNYRKFKGTGPFAGFYWFTRPAVFVLDRELVKSILIKDFNKFTDRGFYSNPRDDPLSGQLFLLDGHKWRSMRNKLSPTFTSGKMKLMFPTIVRIGEEFVNVMGAMAKENPNGLEVGDVASRFTMDVIGSCAFGIDCSSLKNPASEFRTMGKKSLVDTRYGTLGVFFVSSFPKLALKFRMKQTPEDIEKFFMGIVTETVAYRERTNVRRNDFLDMLIDLKNKRLMKSEHGDDLTNLSLGEIAAQAFVFLVAGFETSSSTMGYALYELARHPDIQQKVRDEVVSVLAEHNQNFTYECMKDMQYLDQTISETLRLYTIVPLLNRLALEDYPVPGHPKYVIKKGMPVLIPAHAMHHDADYYPNPDTFNPDNFEPERVQQRDSVDWLPFGDGPRNCIGMRFGQMQARVGLAYLLKNYKFSVCDRTPIPLTYNKMSFLLSPEQGIHLRVEPV